MKKFEPLGLTLIALAALSLPLAVNIYQIHYCAPGRTAPVNPYKKYNELTELGEQTARGNDQAAQLLLFALQQENEPQLRQSWLFFHGPRSQAWPQVLEYAALLARTRQMPAARVQLRRSANLARQRGEWPLYQAQFNKMFSEGKLCPRP